MSTSLNVIALISGGKDSLYSLLHCLENGHRLTALANLYPLGPGGSEGPSSGEVEQTREQEDLNSFMYQTVGHSIIPLYAECLGLPLYRRGITGSAVQTGRYYDSSDLAVSKDETEDLIPLLQEIKRKHPEANALCSGAILSTYQRTRVESIAIRLGFVPLAYLWQYPALPPPICRSDSLTGLLEDMAAAHCDARVIKIASGGIPESLLWSNVADPRTQKRLVSGLAPFFPDHEFWLRGAVLGEGGEYETLAINGPRRLWKKRIEVSEAHMDVLTLEGGVNYVKLNGARVVEQDEDIREPDVDAAVPVPRPLDERFQTALSEVPIWGEDHRKEPRSPRAQTSASARSTFSVESLRLQQNFTSSNLFLANITVQDTVAYGTRTFNAMEQMEHIVRHIKDMLMSISPNIETHLTSSSIVSTTLLLRDIAEFAGINTAYASLFRPGEPNPPARVTFACNLPRGIDVSLSLVLSLGARQSRRGLHVQSRSYWAPANIGPYSQAICEPLDQRRNADVNVHDTGLVEVVHVAGQIPLVPQSMDILQAPFVDQAVLSLQHLWRVGQERGVDIWPWGISFLKEESQSHLRAEEACKVWQYAHLIGTRPESDLSDSENEDEDGSGPDAWDLRFNRSTTFQSSHSQVTLGSHLHTLQNPNVFRSDASVTTYIPSFIAAAVTALPRDAPVEWWSLGIANLPKSPISTPRVEVVTRSYKWGVITVNTIEPTTPPPEEESSQSTLLVTNLVTVLVRSSTARDTDADADTVDIEKPLSNLLSPGGNADLTERSQLHAVHGTAFVSSEGERCWAQTASQTLLAAVTLVPCTSIFGSSARTISKESSEFSNAIKNASQLTSQSTDTDCQPLDLALTLRIERSVDHGRSHLKPAQDF